MFIIYGWKTMPEPIGEGQFFCPSCQRTCGYNHQQTRTWATVFFIPIFPMGTGERVVQCKLCALSFVEDVLNLSALIADASTFHQGERVLGKRGEYWYPGTIRSKAGKKFKVDFDDGKQDLLGKSLLTALDLRVGDPMFVRIANLPEYQFGSITAMEGEKLQVRFEDGRQDSTTLANVRVIWEEEVAT
jgi:hypothetical protein